MKLETSQYINGVNADHNQSFSLNDALSNIGESGTPKIMNSKSHNDSTGGKAYSKEMNYNIWGTENSAKKVSTGYYPGSNNKISSPGNLGNMLSII